MFQLPIASQQNYPVSLKTVLLILKILWVLNLDRAQWGPYSCLRHCDDPDGCFTAWSSARRLGWLGAGWGGLGQAGAVARVLALVEAGSSVLLNVHSELSSPPWPSRAGLLTRQLRTSQDEEAGGAHSLIRVGHRLGQIQGEGLFPGSALL